MLFIDYHQLSKDLVIQMLIDSDMDFNPPLSEYLDLSCYADKLYNHAHFISLLEGDKIYGCLAYYLNDKEHFVYITFLWISEVIQRNGWGKKMFNDLQSQTVGSFNEIRLEVTKINSKALSFYLKNGFKIEEDRGNKYLLKKLI